MVKRMKKIQIVFLLVLGSLITVGFVTGDGGPYYPDSISKTGQTQADQSGVDFSGAPTSGRAPLMVMFTDLTKGNPSGWLWDFGDGTTADMENPVHTYTHGGVYTVRLTAYNQDGSSGTMVKDQYITANPVTIFANFSAEPLSGLAPLTVQFTDQSVGARVWLWNFGDGSSESMTPDPSHLFTRPGTYPVRLTVSNELGETAVHQQEINVSSPDQITAGFVGSPVSGPAPLTVQYTDQSTGNANTWLWDLGDGTRNTTQNPIHTYAKDGMYTVTLTVSSAHGDSDSEEKLNYIRVGKSPVSGSLPLSPGWNFVSVPGILAPGYDTAKIFQQVEVDGHSAFQYNSAISGWTPLTSSSPVRPLEGYWIYSKKTDLVPLTFDQTIRQSPSRSLLKGWNAIGFTGLKNSEVRLALSSVKDSWQNCIGFNPALQRYDSMIFKGVNDDARIQPYGGYWVYMSGPGILNGVEL